MLINTEGIVLRQSKIANNRRIITLFTRRYGKITAGTSINERAKGRAAFAIRPLHMRNMTYLKGETISISQCGCKGSYYSIKKI